MSSLAFFSALRLRQITIRLGQAQDSISITAISRWWIHTTAPWWWLNCHSSITNTVTLPNRWISSFTEKNSVFYITPIGIFHPARPFTWPAVLLAGPHSSHESVFYLLTQRSFAFCDLDQTRYKSHSFRIGTALWATANGMLDAQIRLFGRWKSNAFLLYIRIPSISKRTDTVTSK